MENHKNNFIVEAFIISLLLEAPLRFYTNYFGFGYFIYLPKLLMLAYTLYSLFTFHTKKLVGLYILFAHLILFSFLNIGVSQSLFFLWSMVPFFYGIVFGSRFFHCHSLVRINIYFFIAVVGAVLSYFYDMPWLGMDANLAGYDVNVSKEWDSYGIARISGFSRVSFNLATQILFLAMLIISLSASSYYKFTTWIVAGWIIMISTTKATLISWILLSLVYLFIFFGFFRFVRLFCLTGVFFFFCLTFLLPSIDYQTISNLVDYGNDPILMFALSSFMERFEWMWPDSFALMNIGDFTNYFSGRGLGGLGAAQVYFEQEKFRAGDNNFVYMLVNFGLFFTIIFYSFLSTYIIKNYRTINLLIFGLLLYISLYGIFVSTWEEPLLCLITGVLLSTSMSRFKTEPQLLPSYKA